MKKAKVMTLTKWSTSIYNSNGLIKTDKEGIDGYDKGAILPSFDWTKINVLPNLKKYNDLDNNLGENILIDFLPKELIKLISFFDPSSCDTSEELFNRFQNRADIFEKFTSLLEIFFNSKTFKFSENIKYHRFAVRPAGQKSVSFSLKENDSKTLMGLHIDRSEYFPIGECYKSQQRFCINFGETRYLYFSDISIDELKLIYKERHNKELTFDSLMEVIISHQPII